jgi:hypothetical protein
MQQQGTWHYFERRAEEERAAALRATNERAAQVHRELAEHYGELATGGEQIANDESAAEAGILPKDFQIVP